MAHRTDLTYKAVADLAGFTTKFPDNWDIYNQVFSGYLSAIKRIVDTKQIPEYLQGRELDDYKNRLVNSAVGEIIAILDNCKDGRGFINFNESTKLHDYQREAMVDFAQAIQCELMKQGREFEGEKMFDAATGRLDNVWTVKSTPMPEYSMVGRAVAQLNDYLDKNPEITQGMDYFNVADYLQSYQTYTR